MPLKIRLPFLYTGLVSASKLESGLFHSPWNIWGQINAFNILQKKKVAWPSPHNFHILEKW